MKKHTDKERLDWLQREANKEPLLLHYGVGTNSKGFRGLGLNSLNRTLRQAIDQAMGYERDNA